MSNIYVIRVSEKGGERMWLRKKCYKNNGWKFPKFGEIFKLSGLGSSVHLKLDELKEIHPRHNIIRQLKNQDKNLWFIKWDTHKTTKEFKIPLYLSLYLYIRYSPPRIPYIFPFICLSLPLKVNTKVTFVIKPVCFSYYLYIYHLCTHP